MVVKVAAAMVAAVMVVVEGRMVALVGKVVAMVRAAWVGAPGAEAMATVAEEVGAVTYFVAVSATGGVSARQ